MVEQTFSLLLKIVQFRFMALTKEKLIKRNFFFSLEKMNWLVNKIQKLQKVGHILFVLERYLPSSLLSVSSYLYPHIHFILVQFFSGPKFPLNYHLFFFVFVFVFPYLMLWFLPPGERLLPQHLGQQSKRLSTSTWASFQPNSLIPDTTI